ncbi:Sequence-specific DNA binding [Coemansia sp. RSA 25]|nr:Sequence-specific DNA binding [Coemansia sp. RSA 25]
MSDPTVPAALTTTSTTTIEDLDFPKAVLTRVIKSSLPDSISIQKEARQSVSKASTVFVSYLAATANDCARESGHKTIMTGDVFKALEAIGLSDFIDRLKADLDAFGNRSREKKEQRSRDAAGPTTGNDDEEGEEGDGEDDDVVEEIEDDDDAVGKDVAMDVDDDAADSAKRPRTE